MPINEKLEKWRDKSDKEKHTLAIVGATVLTSLVAILWGYTFFSGLAGSPAEIAKTEAYSEQFSPLAPLKNLLSKNVEKIKAGGESAKNSASAIFLGSTTTENN